MHFRSFCNRNMFQISNIHTRRTNIARRREREMLWCSVKMSENAHEIFNSLPPVAAFIHFTLSKFHVRNPNRPPSRFPLFPQMKHIRSEIENEKSLKLEFFKNISHSMHPNAMRKQELLHILRNTTMKLNWKLSKNMSICEPAIENSKRARKKFLCLNCGKFLKEFRRLCEVSFKNYEKVSC